MPETRNLTDIRSLDLVQMEDEFTRMGEKTFRARQVYDWLWNKSVTDFHRMTNLPLDFRNRLEENYALHPALPDVSQVSADRTIKAAFRLHDGNFIESVLIPRKNRMTVCLSSQAGCSLACRFCATGYLERKRNLEAGEIYDQVVQMNRWSKEKYDTGITNIVFMGMWEPLLNYNNVMRAIGLITSVEGLNFAARRITLSTAGIAKMIRKLADDGAKFRLALSLHAADDEKRSRIMPINESNSLGAVREALEYFSQATRNLITFEYILFKDFNDSPEDAEKLYRYTKTVPCKINIIEYNPIREADFKNADPERTAMFAAYLQDKGVNVKIRKSRGKDIDAACGQLANRKTGGDLFPASLE